MGPATCLSLPLILASLFGVAVDGLLPPAGGDVKAGVRPSVASSQFCAPSWPTWMQAYGASRLLRQERQQHQQLQPRQRQQTRAASTPGAPCLMRMPPATGRRGGTWPALSAISSAVGWTSAPGRRGRRTSRHTRGRSSEARPRSSSSTARSRRRPRSGGRPWPHRPSLPGRGPGAQWAASAGRLEWFRNRRRAVIGSPTRPHCRRGGALASLATATGCPDVARGPNVRRGRTVGPASGTYARSVAARS